MKALANYFRYSGKTYICIATVACICNSVPGIGGAFWFLMLIWLSIIIQVQVNKCYMRSPLQGYFDEVNEARKSRIHRERMTARLMARGHDKSTASKAADITLDVLNYADYSLPAA